jgi:hypothetical protein
MRGRKTNLAERQQILETDEWSLEVQEGRVKCRGCRTWVKLQTGRKYDLKDWGKHKEVCPQITGFKMVRVGAKKARQMKVAHLLWVIINWHLMSYFLSGQMESQQ